ncbi:hypothetical protein [Thermotalea metallivorans]|uniref:Uncharacterized protein n=1 Tax=Thermotalea metallivorans TaxID=520762 RepID=A0A140KZJ5_9FIRM|nr:hypothetical protein [Thermotalea metallivorans]KXG73720.1 hypothetical protein AN619_29380 [Thermotalea metallivorans]
MSETNVVTKQKKIKKNFYIITGCIFFIVFTLIAVGFTSGLINKIKTIKSSQGELLFYSVDENEIIEKKLKPWIDQNKIQAGIHVKKDGLLSKDEFQYILIAGGDQKNDLDISITSIEGFKDKILIHGKVLPIISGSVETEEKTFYPYKIIKIEKDSRNIVLGNLNLFDVYNAKEHTQYVGVDLAIAEEIKENTLKINFRRKQLIALA